MLQWSSPPSHFVTEVICLNLRRFPRERFHIRISARMWLSGRDLGVKGPPFEEQNEGLDEPSLELWDIGKPQCS